MRKDTKEEKRERGSWLQTNRCRGGKEGTTEGGKERETGGKGGKTGGRDR